MEYTYHMHTPRCSHATGTPREYIENAISSGMTHIGFSDHCPLMFEDGYQTSWKVPVEEGRDYCLEIAELRREYGEKIDIKIGFEMEYYADKFEDTFKKVLDYGAEYLILGQHFCMSEHEHPSYIHSCFETDSVERLKTYADVICEAMSRGVYTYVAHPDIFNFTGDEETYVKEMQRICEASVKYDTPLELNLLGIREGRHYPKAIFWKLAGEIGCPVVFGTDSHKAEHASDPNSAKKAYELVEKYGLNYIGRPKIIEIQKLK